MHTEKLHQRIFRLLAWNSFFRKFVYPPYYSYVIRGSVAAVVLRNEVGAFDSFDGSSSLIAKGGSALLDRDSQVENGYKQSASDTALNREEDFASIPTTYGTSLKIMPLGDSITSGTIGTNDKQSGGYRPELWNLLVASGLNIDFVGSISGKPSSLSSTRHEGHEGWKIQNIARHINGWLNTYEPDIIMLMIGTNDTQKHSLKIMINQLSDLIDQITAQLPHARLIVASIPPIHPAIKPISRCLRAIYFNTAIPSIVNSKVAQGKKVHFADMSSLSVNDLTSSLGLNLDNGLHPNAEGYRKIANFWYGAVLKVLPPQASSINPYYQLPRTLKYDE